MVVNEGLEKAKPIINLIQAPGTDDFIIPSEGHGGNPTFECAMKEKELSLLHSEVRTSDL